MFTPPLTIPTVSGSTVTLRPFRASDLDAVVEASTDPLIPLITTVPPVVDRGLAATFLDRQHERAMTGAGYSLAIEAGGRCVGQIGLWLRDLDQGRATIGYWIRPSARHRGFAGDALSTLSQWALTIPEVHRLQLYIEPRNEASWRTAERAGYEREGLLRSWEVVGNERRDMYMYAAVRSPGDGRG